MVHLNGNLLCAVAIRTTGKLPKIHDLFEVCVMPITHSLKPDMSRLPFHFNLVCKRPENLWPEGENYRIKGYNKAAFYKMQAENAVDPYSAADTFEQWFDSLQLGRNKTLYTLTYDHGFVKPFLIDWLGTKTYDYIFDYRVRDVLGTTLFMNDRADISNTQIPYPKTELSCMATREGLERSYCCHETCVNMIGLYQKCVYNFT